MGDFGGGKGGGGGIDLPINDIRTLMGLEQEAMDRAAQRTADFNFFDVRTPFGSQTFTGTPGTAGFQQNVNLAPEDQALLDQRRNVLGLLGGFGLQQAQQSGDLLGNPLLGGQALTDSAAALEQATFDRGRNLLQPDLDRQRQQLESQLIARGLPRDSEAFLAEMGRLDRSQGQALENLALSSVGAGRQEQSRLLQSDIARRNAALNEIGGLVSGPTGLPSFQSTPNIQVGAANAGNFAGPLLGIQQQQLMNQQANQAAALGGLFDIGSAALLGSGFGF